MRLTNSLLAGAALCALGLGLSTSANAAGFFLQEQSVSGLGTAYAGEGAAARDAAALFFNPASIGKLDGRQVNLGVHALFVDAQLEDTGTTINGTSLAARGQPSGDGGNPLGLNMIPNAYFATPITDDNKWWAGFGISAPFGLGTEYDSDFFGRFSSLKTELRTIDFQPTLAYNHSDWLTIGGTMIVQYARANLKQNIATPTTAEVGVDVTGDDVSMGYNVGVILTPMDRTSIGLSYRSQIHQELTGKQISTPTNSLGPDSTAVAKLKLPDIGRIDIAQGLNDRWTVLGSATWYGWGNTDTLTVLPTNASTVGPSLTFGYRNEWSYAVGLEYMYSEDWTLRAGFQYDQTPTTDEFRSTLNVDSDRNWYAVGATYSHSDAMTFDFSLAYVDAEEETVNRTTVTTGPTTTITNARSDDPYSVIGAVALNYKF